MLREEHILMLARPLALSLLTLITTCGTVAAFEFGAAKNYPKMGIMLALPYAARAEPLPMPLAHTFLSTGVDLTREDRFVPYDLWYGAQCCGRWHDKFGNQLVIGRATHLLPRFTQQTVTRENFHARLADSANLLNPRKREQLDAWVADFADQPLQPPVKRKLNKFALEEVWCYPSESEDVLIYALLPRRVGNAEGHDWFCVLFRLAEQVELPQAMALFENGFVNKITLPPRASKSTGAQANEMVVQERGEKTAAQPHHPVRQAVRKSIENYEEWWYADTDGYTIVSDLQDVVGRSIIQDLKEQLPLLHNAYKSLTPLMVDERDIALVRIFQRREDYARYIGEEQIWSGGAWIPGRRELVLFLHENREETMKVIRHEAYHQYLSNATAMLGAAPWLNEGHACFFENARVNAKKGEVVLPEDDERCQMLLEHLESAVLLLPLVIQMNYDEFYDGTDFVRKLKYALAWGLVYYLQKGVPLERASPYAQIIEEYATWLSVTRDQQQATLLAFKDIEMAKFQESFVAFWQSSRVKAAHFNPLK